MTDYFAGRRAGHNLHCEGMAKDAPDSAACRVGVVLCCTLLGAACPFRGCLRPARHAAWVVAAGACQDSGSAGVGGLQGRWHVHQLRRLPCHPLSCPPQDAHADVVMWSSWTSFFSNSFVSIVLVSRRWAFERIWSEHEHTTPAGLSVQHRKPHSQTAANRSLCLSPAHC